MRSRPTALAGALLLEPTVHADERGWFFESWNASRMAELGIRTDLVQDNHARSALGVLRGLHWQADPPQAKLVRCVRGRIYDVIVDVRRRSPQRGQWFGVELSEENRLQLWIPHGFAHGYLALSDGAEVCYKVSSLWNRQSERGLRWDDPLLAIRWPLDGSAPLVNARDRSWPAIDAGDAYAWAD